MVEFGYLVDYSLLGREDFLHFSIFSDITKFDTILPYSFLAPTTMPVNDHHTPRLHR